MIIIGKFMFQHPTKPQARRCFIVAPQAISWPIESWVGILTDKKWGITNQIMACIYQIRKYTIAVYQNRNNKGLKQEFRVLTLGPFGSYPKRCTVCHSD